MTLPGTIAGTIGRFEADIDSLQSYEAQHHVRVLDVDEGAQTELSGSGLTVTGRAATEYSDKERTVTIDGTTIDLGREEITARLGTEWAIRGRIALSERVLEESGGAFPFTLLSAVSNVTCERLLFDTEAVREAWKEDGKLSDTWMAGTKNFDKEDQGTTIAYGKASAGQKSDIGLGFKRAWEGYLLQGVVYASGYVAVYEDDIGRNGFLRFVEECLVPHGYVPEDPAEAFFQETLGDEEDDDE